MKFHDLPKQVQDDILIGECTCAPRSMSVVEHKLCKYCKAMKIYHDLNRDTTDRHTEKYVPTTYWPSSPNSVRWPKGQFYCDCMRSGGTCGCVLHSQVWC